MAESTHALTTWKVATAIALVIAGGAVAWGYQQQHQAAKVSEAYATAQQRISVLSSQLSEEAKRDLPIVVSFRRAVLGNGLVVIFRNDSGSTLEAAAELSSPATGEKRTAHLVLPPNGVQEIGYAQGWPVVAGQHIRLVNNAYRPAEYIVTGS